MLPVREATLGSPRSPESTVSVRSQITWVALAAVAMAMGWVAFGYVTGNPAEFDDRFHDRYVRHLAVVVFHGVLGVGALVLGPLQFMPGLRQVWPSAHRTVGLLYLTAVLFGSLAGLRMALMAEGGPAARLGFVLLALGWLATGALAVRAARAGRYARHRDWMVRNYALTFSAVTLRLGLHGFQAAGVAWATLYPIMAYASWLPNLAVAEAILHWEAPR